MSSLARFASIAILILTALLALSSAAARAEDARQLVVMPDAAREIMRQAMIENLGTLNGIVALLAENRLQDAGKLAESGFGMSSMGRHMGGGGGSGMGPGRFMPDGMRALALGMHAAASDFARAAESGDSAKTLAALQGVTANCFACHSSYRTR
jgi:cytochrome c556